MGGRAGFGSSPRQKPPKNQKPQQSKMRSFEYDPAKSVSNKEEHGIDFEEAKALWDDTEKIENALSYASEPRTMTVGLINGKHYSAITTMRDTTTRIISVRRSRENEVKRYETANN